MSDGGTGRSAPAGSKGPGTVELSIVVPAFNEARRLGTGTERLQRAVDDGAVDPERTEIIVVDDGSTDGTAECAQDLLAGFPHLQVLSQPVNAGKGAAVRAGVAAARGSAIAHMDADMAIDPVQIKELIAGLDHADIAIGSRTLAESSAERALVRRSLMGRAFNGLVNVITHVGLRDTQCGFKAFRAPVAHLLFDLTVIDRFAFDVEVLTTARRLGFSITEVPVRWQHVGGSRIRPLSDPASMAADLLRIGSRLSAPRVVPAISVAVAPGGPSITEAVCAIAGNGFPVVDRSPGRLLVLLPLSDARRRSDLVDQLAALPGVSTHQLSVTLRQLRHMAPLVLRGTLRPGRGGRPGGRPKVGDTELGARARPDPHRDTDPDPEG
ncbi:MAG: glycosyltransferase [Acidimicrobiales bacterium]